jgi:hypothetical protein
MGKKTRYILWVIFLAFPWVSQLLFPAESILEPIWWTIGIAAIIFAIETWGKP